jgi:hypothetical protein
MSDPKQPAYTGFVLPLRDLDQLFSAIKHGLYFEHGEVRSDCFDDWEVFWSPLLAGIGRARC